MTRASIDAIFIVVEDVGTSSVMKVKNGVPVDKRVIVVAEERLGQKMSLTAWGSAIDRVHGLQPGQSLLARGLIAQYYNDGVELVAGDLAIFTVDGAIPEAMDARLWFSSLEPAARDGLPMLSVGGKERDPRPISL